MNITEPQLLTLIEQTFRLKKSSINLDTNLNDFPKDSMDIVEFIAILADSYSIEVVPEQLMKAVTIRDLFDQFNQTTKKKTVKKTTSETNH